jgi:hypothetical protein
MSVRIAITAAAVSALALASFVQPSQAASLDYEYFKAKVQPIFVTKREGHAPCVMCHAEANNMLSLQKLPDGFGSAWSEEATRKNFDTVTKIVEAADDPLQSKILVHPLAPEAGGDAFHNGGRQFENKDDPSWKIIADWAKGAKLAK